VTKKNAIRVAVITAAVLIFILPFGGFGLAALISWKPALLKLVR
jgi:hypothetical protein